MLFSERLNYQNKFEHWCATVGEGKYVAGRDLSTAIVWMVKEDEGKELVRKLYEEMIPNDQLHK